MQKKINKINILLYYENRSFKHMMKRSRMRPNVVRTGTKGSGNSTGNMNHSTSDDREVRLKPRNHYQQLLDKYNNLARETLRGGDRIEAEVYFQHAEHYLRQLNERIRYEQDMQSAHQQKQVQRDQERRQKQAHTQSHQNNGSDHAASSEQSANDHVGAELSEQAERPTRAVKTNRSALSSAIEQDLTHASDSVAGDENGHDSARKQMVKRRGPRLYYKKSSSNANSNANDQGNGQGASIPTGEA